MNQFPTIREFLWNVFAKGYRHVPEAKEKLAQYVNEKCGHLRRRHPEYRLTARGLDYHYCIWKKTLPENQKVWRKM